MAILLEIYAVIIQINSDWTDNWHQKNDMHRESVLGAWYHHPSKPMWSNFIARYNLLSFCLVEKPAVCYEVQKLLGLDEFREKQGKKAYKMESSNLKSLIFNQFKRYAEASAPGPPALCVRRGSFAL